MKMSILTRSLLVVTIGAIGGCSESGSANGNAIGDAFRKVTGVNVDQRVVKGAEAGVKAGRALALGEADEIEMGRSVAVALTHQYPLTTNMTLNAYVTKVGLTIAAASERPELPFTFGVLETTDVGAFSGPGGYVFITTGALALMQDESELAGVLAHETAHVSRRHGLAAVKEAGFSEAAKDAANARGVSINYAQGRLTDQFVETALTRGYSRSQENDADTSAVLYLQAAGYDARGYSRFLARLASTRAPTGHAAMSTHPGLAERAARVTQLAGAGGGAVLAERFVKTVKKT